mgnify:FL=1
MSTTLLQQKLEKERVEYGGESALEVKVEECEIEKEVKKSEEMSEASSELIVHGKASVYSFPNELNFALFSVSAFVRIERSRVKLVMQCSIPKLLVQFTSFHGVCLLGDRSIWYHFMEQPESVRTNGELIRTPYFYSCLLPMVHSSSLPSFEHYFHPHTCISYADFEGKCKEPSMQSQVESIDGRNHVSQGVFAFNSYSTPSYHLINDVPLLMYPISGSKQAETHFVFVGCKAARNFPALIKELQPDFMLVPAACNLPCIFIHPKAGHHEIILSTQTGANSSDSSGV